MRLVLSMVDLLMVNDAEARELTGDYSLVKAARKIMAMGPKFLVIKKGNTAPYYFMPMKYSLRLHCHSKMFSTQQVPVIHLQAGLWGMLPALKTSLFKI
ncbi:MAG: hypothetical protein WDM78_20785 [Puia sp.]